MERLLRPTEVSEVWELLWPLPVTEEDLESEAADLTDLNGEALRLLARYGGHAVYGSHYRELILLVTRSVGRYLEWLIQAKAVDLPELVLKLVPHDRIEAILRTTSGLPPLFTLQWRQLLERIQRVGA